MSTSVLRISFFQPEERKTSHAKGMPNNREVMVAMSAILKDVSRPLMTSGRRSTFRPIEMTNTAGKSTKKRKNRIATAYSEDETHFFFDNWLIARKIRFMPLTTPCHKGEQIETNGAGRI